MNKTIKIAAFLIIASTAGASAQLDLLLAKKQTPKQYAQYASQEFSARIPMSDAQKAEVYILYYNYANWITAKDRSKSEVRAYKQMRNDTLKNILGTPGYYIPEMKK